MMKILTDTPTGMPASLGCFMLLFATQVQSIPLIWMSHGYAGMARIRTPAISQDGRLIICHGSDLWSIWRIFLLVTHRHLALLTPHIIRGVHFIPAFHHGMTNELLPPSKSTRLPSEGNLDFNFFYVNM